MKSRQAGAFTVEAVFGITVLMTMMLFLADLSNLVLAKTQASRVSYSLATATKERLRFFDGRQAVTNNDFSLINAIAADLLTKQAPVKQDGYGLVIESFTDTGIQSFSKSFNSGQTCEPEVPITSLNHLRPVREDGVIFPIYQVTVCLKLDGLFQLLPTLRSISSSSVLPGR